MKQLSTTSQGWRSARMIFDRGRLIERERAEKAVDQIVAVADDGALRRRHQRIIAIDDLRVREVARRRDLRIRLIVHEPVFGVRLKPAIDLVIREKSSGMAFIKTLIIVERCEIVGRRRARDEPAAGLKRVEDRPLTGENPGKEFRMSSTRVTPCSFRSSD